VCVTIGERKIRPGWGASTGELEAPQPANRRHARADEAGELEAQELVQWAQGSSTVEIKVPLSMSLSCRQRKRWRLRRGRVQAEMESASDWGRERPSLACKSGSSACGSMCLSSCASLLHVRVATASPSSCLCSCALLLSTALYMCDACGGLTERDIGWFRARDKVQVGSRG
jgi:hypothetical protein